MWNHLPPEIWLSIFEFIDRSSLLDCSLASREVNVLCNRIIWSAFTLPLYFSKRSRGFYLVAQALLAHPERARAVRRLTLSLRCTQPRSKSQARYIHLTMPSQLEQLLSLMAGITHLTINVADGFYTHDFLQLRGQFRSLDSPLTIWSDAWGDEMCACSKTRIEYSELIWTPIVRWIATLPLHTLSSKYLTFDRFINIISKCPSIEDIEFDLKPGDQGPLGAIPPCLYLDRVANGEASVPISIAEAVLSSSKNPTSVIIQRHNLWSSSLSSQYEALGRWMCRTNTVQLLKAEELPPHRFETMLENVPFPCPSLLAIVEIREGSSTFWPDPLHLHVITIARIFTMAPSLRTYVVRWEDYERELWERYREKWPAEKRGASALKNLLDKFRDRFTNIENRGILRVIVEAGKLHEEKCLYWVFQRDPEGVWSMHWDKSTEGRNVTPKERDQYYIHPPLA
ncbi:hypothetical protein DL93DRAFT_2077784, partial [Clavulina sp. PMI_390]